MKGNSTAAALTIVIIFDLKDLRTAHYDHFCATLQTAIASF